MSAGHKIRAAVLTISDRCHRGDAQDTAGPAVSALLELGLDAEVIRAGIVPDEREQVAEALVQAVDAGCELVLTVGGTGCAARDITPEATLTVIEREVPGLAEAMRAASREVTPHALLSRAVCGIRGNSLIVNLPGSLKAATENLEAIRSALPHAVRLLRGETAHPEADRHRGGSTAAG
ncbi:MAG: MogA/MoaB family molybdenum cofactor biosynthesis protein [Acidobacteriota bacterium]|nr:MogA/MoaB family molybdenum cofactor biosynthesis protein [Acidobacteriota bacterium]MDQ7088354.1 MogA/MoaB family molybdenum cofactor biosynthesis protein [Acidobacteriota bacterium]